MTPSDAVRELTRLTEELGGYDHEFGRTPKPPKPTDCKCAGDEHVNPLCFVTPRPSPTIAELLTRLGRPMNDEGIRDALEELADIRDALDAPK